MLLIFTFRFTQIQIWNSLKDSVEMAQALQSFKSMMAFIWQVHSFNLYNLSPHSLAAHTHAHMQRFSFMTINVRTTSASTTPMYLRSLPLLVRPQIAVLRWRVSYPYCRYCVTFFLNSDASPSCVLIQHIVYAFFFLLGFVFPSKIFMFIYLLFMRIKFA